MTKIIIKNKKANIAKMLAFGFVRRNDAYAYTAELADVQMSLTVTVSKDGDVQTEMTDVTSGEEYTLHLVEGVTGAFVGRVRSEYEAVLGKMISECYDIDVFKGEQTKSVIAYMLDKYGDEPEYLWKKFPNNAVVRRKDNKKWYAALLTVSRRKLGFDSDEPVEILDLRSRPEDIERTVDNIKYFPGYHMNKKHWITVCLDGSLSTEEICTMIDESLTLAKK